MKQSLFKTSLLLVSLSAIILSCKKEGGEDATATGPGIAYVTDGFLCTMGKNTQGQPDTLVFYFSTNGQQMTVYSRGFPRPQDAVKLISNGNNTLSIEKKIPYVHNNKSYSNFGIIKSNPATSPFPSHPYLFYMFHADPSDETQFIIKRNDTDGEKFTIESKAYPGYYLGVAKWANATEPTEDRLVFTSSKKEFFFMAN